MAVKNIDELKGDGSRGMHWDIQSGRTYQRRFQVITDSFTDGPAVVLAAFGRRMGGQYACSYNAAEKDVTCFCNSIDIGEVGDDGTQWMIVLSYGWLDPQQAGGGEDNNPLEKPIEVAWDHNDHSTIIERDIDGALVLNTAGDRFDPPLEVDTPRRTMTVVRNEASFNRALADQYSNAINSDVFGDSDPFTVKCNSITARSQWDQVCGWHYQVTYIFEFMTPKVNDVGEGFRKQVLSQGYRAISRTDGKVYGVTKKGVPINQPILLDENGYEITDQAVDPTFVDVKVYPELKFDVFGFDPGAISGQRTGLDYSAAPPEGA